MPRVLTTARRKDLARLHAKKCPRCAAKPVTQCKACLAGHPCTHFRSVMELEDDELDAFWFRWRWRNFNFNFVQILSLYHLFYSHLFDRTFWRWRLERFGGLILTTTGGNSLRQPQHPPPRSQVPVGFAKVRVFVHVKWSVRFRAPSLFCFSCGRLGTPSYGRRVVDALRFGWVKHRGVGRRMVFFSLLFSGDEQRQRLFPFAPEPPLSCSNQKVGMAVASETAGGDGANRPCLIKCGFGVAKVFGADTFLGCLLEVRLRRRRVFPRG